MKHNFLYQVFILFCTPLILIISCQCNLASKNSTNAKGFVVDTNIPQPVGYVNDFEDIYSKSEEITLDSIIKDYNKRADVEISLATFDTNMVKKDSFQSYTLSGPTMGRWRKGKG